MSKSKIFKTLTIFALATSISIQSGPREWAAKGCEECVKETFKGVYKLFLKNYIVKPLDRKKVLERIVNTLRKGSE